MSCTYNMLRNREAIFQKLLGKYVKVKAGDVEVQGVLRAVETSKHDGFGNLIIQTASGSAIVRGSQVTAIGEVAEK